VVGHLVDAVVGHVADGNAVVPGGGEVDVVDADAVADDHPGTAHRRDDVGVHRRELRDHGVGVGHRLGETGRVLRLGGDELGAGRGDDLLLEREVVEGMVGDDDFHGLLLGVAENPKRKA
jgi:hypothetical protein